MLWIVDCVAQRPYNTGRVEDKTTVPKEAGVGTYTLSARMMETAVLKAGFVFLM